ncbi:hypothetical protein AB5J62_29235 [Amycolatopsis sp. cg5]|uniref:hypothetical protein n=1 Tax=Amycolatopsis sp. cg5 TaxID=3238802 RepID=UPI0035234E4D
MTVLFAVATVGLIVDDRTLVNASLWAKPWKFSISIALYTVTLSWMITLLPKWRRAGWWAGTAVAVALAADMVLLVWQIAFRGRQLHFNVAGELDRTINGWLANAAFTAWGATLVLGVLLLFQKLPDKAQASAVRGGLAVALTGLMLGMLMFGPKPEQEAVWQAGGKPPVVGGHSVGVPDGGPGLPLIGWSTTGGDLRIPHFVGMHALQLLPLLAALLLMLAARFPVLRDELVRRRLMRTATVGYFGLVALVTWQALRGQSIVRPDFWTMAAGAGLVLGVAAATWGVLAVTPARDIRKTPVLHDLK